eukprot:Hpha_TRINITY_DN20992_c0_g1::TRINITY_DN20992_c0_g1_i1::g.139666::m.139666
MQKQMSSEQPAADQPVRATLPYAVCVLNVHGCLNAGAIMRSATLCGCRKIIVFGRRKYDKRSAVGAQHYIEVERVDGLTAERADSAEKDVLERGDYDLDADVFYSYMEEKKYLPVFVEQCADSLVLSDASVLRILQQHEVASGDRTPCFIFGNEQTGIPANIIATRARFAKSYAIELRQLGALESFNVSSCASIVLYRVMESFLSFLPEPVQQKRNEAKRAAPVAAEEVTGVEPGA